MPLSPRHRLSGIVARFSGCRIGERCSPEGFGRVLRPPDNTGKYQVRFPHGLHTNCSAGGAKRNPPLRCAEADHDGLPDISRPAARPSWLLLAAKNANQRLMLLKTIRNSR